MKKMVFFVLMTSILMLFSSSALAREKDDKDVIFRLSFITPGLGAEFRIKDNFTILGHAGVGIVGKAEDDKNKTFSLSTHVVFPLYVYISPRYYYNLEKRKKQSKRVDNFSANFVGMIFSNMFESSIIDQRFFIAGIWGLRRSFGKNWYYELSIGLEIYSTDDKKDLRLRLDYSLGIIL